MSQFCCTPSGWEGGVHLVPPPSLPWIPPMALDPGSAIGLPPGPGRGNGKIHENTWNVLYKWNFPAIYKYKQTYIYIYAVYVCICIYIYIYISYIYNIYIIYRKFPAPLPVSTALWASRRQGVLAASQGTAQPAQRGAMAEWRPWGVNPPRSGVKDLWVGLNIEGVSEKHRKTRCNSSKDIYG